MSPRTAVDIPAPGFFAAHPHLSGAVNRNIIQSEVEGGVYLRDLPPGAVLAIQTQNRFYTLVTLGGESALLSGHPEFCPDPVVVRIQGSTWGGSMQAEVCRTGDASRIRASRTSHRAHVEGGGYPRACVTDSGEENGIPPLG